jgi:hypothetical protein
MTLSSIWAANRELRTELANLALDAAVEMPEGPLIEADAIVSHIEVNDHHGVGVLVNRLFGDLDNVLSIRSRNFYDGHQDFGARHICIAHFEHSRDSVFWHVLESLQGTTIRRIICIPYFPDDVLNALALKTIFGAPLCTYLMDDQNLSTEGIPDSLIAQLLNESRLRLAISPELCAGYMRKYHVKMWCMPPLAPRRLIPARVNEPSEVSLRSRDGVILGNIWGQHWVEMLRQTVRGSNISLRWYNNGAFRWLPCSIEELVRDGIQPQQGERHSDDELTHILREAAYVVVPSGTLDDDDDRHFIARLSLPSRIPYILATSHTPVIVLGSPQTAAARFVAEAGIGIVVPYERHAFQEALEQITRRERNRELRCAAFRIAARFSDAGASDWIWQSLARGTPVDNRYGTGSI